MIRTWNALGLSLILAGALTTPAAGQGGKPSEPNRDDVIAKELRDLRTAVEALTKEIRDAQSARFNSDSRAPTNSKDIEEIRRTIAQLRSDLDNLSQRSATERRAGYQPIPPAPTGRIRLVNTYMQAVSIRVNGRVYPLPPGETRTIDAMPTGAFTYEVLGITGATNRTLDANETFTITVHPS